MRALIAAVPTPAVNWNAAAPNLLVDASMSAAILAVALLVAARWWVNSALWQAARCFKVCVT